MQLDYFGRRAGFVERRDVVGGQRQAVAAARLSSCSTDVALAIGAVTLGRAISHASATVAGVRVVALRHVDERIDDPQAPVVQIFLDPRAARAPCSVSAFERYLPLRKPLARL